MGEVSLTSIALLLGITVLAVAVLRRFQVPTVIAYLAAGVVLGPQVLGWLGSDGQSSPVAELGVVLLLFALGLEFSLPRLIAMRRELVVVGGAQVAITLGVMPLLAPLLDVRTETAIVLGAVFAMSSTAIVVKLLAEQTELNLTHGRLAIGVLLFQDLAVVPLLILIPMLASGAEGSIAFGIGRAVVEGALAVTVVLLIGRWLLRPLFHEIASSDSTELFTLAVLLVVVGCAALTHALGLSAALGAFLGGMMLAETEYRHQVEADVRPFRDVLLGAFFIAIGTLLVPRVVLDHWDWVLGALLFVIPFKTALIAFLARTFTADWNGAWRTGLVLAQGGEFGFALIALALTQGVIRAEVGQVVLAAIILSMAIAPFLIRYNSRIAGRLARSTEEAERETLAQEVAQMPGHHTGHVVIVGYGRVGQNVARFLEKESFDYVALDLDPVRIRTARAAGEPVYYGDGTNPDTLRAAGIERARVLLITYWQTNVALKVLHQARRLNPMVPVLVRTKDDSRLDELMAAGATEVIPETLEASLMVASHLLVLLTVPMSRVVRHINEVRGSRYGLLRSVFRGRDARVIDSTHAFREQLETVELSKDARAAGRRLGELGLDEAGILVTAVRREGIVGRNPSPDLVLRAGDVLVLYGKPEDLERADEILLGG
jgi:CPA2 family monovalent cation:H+ antiporter-2